MLFRSFDVRPDGLGGLTVPAEADGSALPVPIIELDAVVGLAVSVFFDDGDHYFPARGRIVTSSAENSVHFRLSTSFCAAFCNSPCSVP